MGNSVLKYLKPIGIFVAIFAMFSIPVMFSGHNVKVVKADIRYPNGARSIASPQKSIMEVASKQCEPAQRWRYRCDENKKNCIKDQYCSTTVSKTRLTNLGCFSTLKHKAVTLYVFVI